MRFLIDDPTKTDPRAALNVVKMALLTDIVAPVDRYLYCTGDNSLAIYGDCIISTASGGVFRTTAQTITAANLDEGAAFEVGKDYYVYLCDPENTTDEIYKVSLNSTFPAGFGALSSRKIGGFHYGKCRRVNAAMQPTNAGGEERGDGWQGAVFDGIVPRSVWTLKHRPKCSPEGMVWVTDFWVDIYLGSDDGAGGLASKYAATPVSGTEGLHFYDFVEKLAAVGKRLPTYDEWLAAALGSPAGNDDDNVNAWTATTNRGRTLTGSVANAVSSFGIRDATGNLWEHTATMITRPFDKAVINGAGTYAASDGERAGKAYTNGNGHYHATNDGVWGWDTTSPFGDDYGNIYEYNDYQLERLLVGGGWGNGRQAGPRAVILDNHAWNVGAYIGGRGACDSL